MRSDGDPASARLEPAVVSVTLSAEPGLSRLSAAELKMLRESRRRADPERPPSGITVDQLSITGMALVFNPGAFWLRRAIWLVIIICLLVWLCVQLRLCVLRLSAGGTVRTWSRLTVTDIPLPAITVCHGNRFKKSVVLRHQLSDAAGWPSWHRDKYRTLNWSSFDGLDQFYQEASYSWGDMVMFCNITNGPCDQVGTIRTLSTLLNGLCTTFNTNVTVTKRLTSSQIVVGFLETESLDEFESNGWSVFLHPQDVQFSDFLVLSGLVASVRIFGNRVHEVKVFRQVTESLPNGDGKGCSTDEDALETYQRCLSLCVTQTIDKQVIKTAADAPRCAVPWVPPEAYKPNTPFCRTIEELERASPGSRGGVTETAFINWTSRCDCDPACRTDQYRIDDQEKWHVEETEIYLAYPEARNATIGVLMLWLSDIQSHVTEREAYSFDSFIADVGGNFGLMLGGSLLTFVEIVDCIIACCVSRRSRRTKELC